MSPSHKYGLTMISDFKFHYECLPWSKNVVILWKLMGLEFYDIIHQDNSKNI